MPIYDFHCITCKSTIEKNVHYIARDDMQYCEICNSLLVRWVSVPMVTPVLPSGSSCSSDHYSPSRSVTSSYPDDRRVRSAEAFSIKEKEE